MKNLKYILIATIFMFVGINEVSASHLDRTCIYETNDGNTKLAVKWEERTIGALGSNIQDVGADIKITYFNTQNVLLENSSIANLADKKNEYMNNKKCFDYGVIMYFENIMVYFKFYLANTLDEATKIYNEQGNEAIAKQIVSLVNDSIPVEDWENIINPDDSNGDGDNDNDVITPEYETGCHIFGDTIIGIIKQIYGYFKWIIPVLIIVLSMLDFLKVVGTGKDDDFKKAQNNLLKRIILGVVFFLIPTLISVIINFSGITEQIDNKNSIWDAVTCILE